MPSLSITQSYTADTLLTEAQLDDIKNSIETFFNTTKLDSDNIQIGGISSAILANDIIDDTILEDDAVTTVKLVDASVTKAKLVALGEQSATQTGGAFSPGSITAIPSANVTLTTSGRPVIVQFYRRHSGSGAGTIYLYRDSTQLAALPMELNSGVMTAFLNSDSAYIDAPAAGTYVYELRFIAAGTTVTDTYIKAYEL